MSNRINQLFQRKASNILSVYFTAGYPELNDTKRILEVLEQNQVDLVEIGIPFSDPTADGPTIQRSSEKALQNGMNLNLLFNQLEGIRNKVNIPLVLMGYFNPVFQFGVDLFLDKCVETGIDGVILPDMPLDEYERSYKHLFEQKGVHNILLITPQTSEARIREIDSKSNGFIYMVSSASTTGAGKTVDDFQLEYFERIRDMNLKNPRLIGFGISDNSTFKNACNFAHGAIIGSAFVQQLGKEGSLEERVGDFVKHIISE